MEAETNLAQLFRHRAATYGDATRWRQKRHGTWCSATWHENQAIVNSLIAGLDALGVRRGDVIGILSRTRWEWLAADWAIIGLGAITTALYPSQTPRHCSFIINDAEARYLFVEDRQQYEKLLSIRHELPQVRMLILFDDADQVAHDPRVISFDQLRQLSRRTSAEADTFAAQRAAALHAEERAAILYTSGTTGRPKGALHTHATLLAQIAGCTAMLSRVHPGMVDLLFLPLAHAMARIEHLAGYERGVVTVIAPSLRRLVQDLREVQPDVFFGAPRLYEQAYATIRTNSLAGPPVRRWIFGWSARVGRQVCHLRQDHQPLPLALRLQERIADRLVLHRVRAAFGGRLAFAVTGAAPLAPAILEFFHGAGVCLLEGWGLTETGGGFTLNTVEHYRIGTVGRAYPGHAIHIARDGEILVRGPCVFAGYHHNQEATAEAIDAEGWFHTGDIGSLDGEGFLRILDRKKDLIITAGGENIAPQRIENRLRAIPGVSQACVFGDGHAYLVALLTLDPAALHAWADARGMPYRVVSDIAATPQFRAFLDEHVTRANRTLAAYEAVRNYAIVPEFTVADELLTPTRKICRRQIYERYRAQFEALYHRRGAQ